MTRLDPDTRDLLPARPEHISPLVAANALTVAMCDVEADGCWSFKGDRLSPDSVVALDMLRKLDSDRLALAYTVDAEQHAACQSPDPVECAVLDEVDAAYVAMVRDHQVAIELRAAEIVHELGEQDSPFERGFWLWDLQNCGLISEGERFGILMWHTDETPGHMDACSNDADAEWAGWLAAEIAWGAL